MSTKRRAKVIGVTVTSGLLLAALVPLASAPASGSTRVAPSAAIARAKATPVFVVGDSLTVGAKPYLRAKLHTHVGPITIDARVGRFTGEGISKLRSSSARHARVWVVALGTNDGPSASQTTTNVKRVMRLAGPSRQVIWVNVVRPGGYNRVNHALAKADKTYTQLRVINWAGYIADHRRYLAGDGVHLSDAGYRRRGAIIAQIVAETAAA